MALLKLDSLPNQSDWKKCSEKKKKTPPTRLTLTLLLMLALSPWPSLPFVIVPALLYMLGHGMAFPNSIAASTEVDPRVLGAATATVAAVSQLLIGLLTSASVRWHDGTGFPLAVVCLLSNILAWTCFVQARRRKALRQVAGPEART